MLKAFKKALFVPILGLLAGICHAACDSSTPPTVTSRFGLSEPVINACGWGVTTNNNWSIVDSSAPCLACSNTFTAENTYGANATITMQTNGTVLFNNQNNTKQSAISNQGTQNSSNKAAMRLFAPDGVGITQAPIDNVGLSVFAGSGQTYGSFAVVGSSADTSLAYVGFQATSPITQSVLWSLPPGDGLSNAPLVTNGSGNFIFKTYAPNQCMQTDVNGVPTVTGATCGSGGGGGSSTLQITQSGVQITSPTSSMNFTSGQFILGSVGSTSTIALNSSSVTLQGQNVILNQSTFQPVVLNITSATFNGQTNVYVTSTTDQRIDAIEAPAFYVSYSTDISNDAGAQTDTIYAKMHNKSHTSTPAVDGIAVHGRAVDEAGSNGQLIGVMGEVFGQGPGAPAYTGLWGTAGWASDLPGGTTSEIEGLRLIAQITNLAGDTPRSTGTLRMLYIPDFTNGHGANNQSWPIYVSAPYPSFFNGFIGLGQRLPVSPLQITISTGTQFAIIVGTAPIGNSTDVGSSNYTFTISTAGDVRSNASAAFNSMNVTTSMNTDYITKNSVLFTSGTQITGSSTTWGVDSSNSQSSAGNTLIDHSSTVQELYGLQTPLAGTIISITSATALTNGVIRELSGNSGSFIINSMGRTGRDMFYGIVGSAGNFFGATAPGDTVIDATQNTESINIGVGTAGGIPATLRVNATSATINGNVVIVSTATTGLYSLTVSTNSAGYQMAISTTGHLLTNEGTRPALSCGTNPTINGTDFAGIVTPGSGTPSPCTVTFAVPYKNTPTCTITEQSPSLVNVMVYAVSNASFTVTQTSLSSTINYTCIGLSD